MSSQIIRKEIEIEAPIEVVWQFLATQEGLRQWWGANITLEAWPGGHCAESGLFANQPYQLVGEVTIYEPPYRLQLTLRDATARYEWPSYSTISLTLSERNNETRVVVVHRRFDQPDLVPQAGLTRPAVKPDFRQAESQPAALLPWSPINARHSQGRSFSVEAEAERWIDRLHALQHQVGSP